jgi:fructose-1-phosphate kinase PfkB-like protein
MKRTGIKKLIKKLKKKSFFAKIMEEPMSMRVFLINTNVCDSDALTTFDSLSDFKDEVKENQKYYSKEIVEQIVISFKNGEDIMLKDENYLYITSKEI